MQQDIHISQTNCLFSLFQEYSSNEKKYHKLYRLKMQEWFWRAFIVKWQHRFHNNKLLSLLFSLWVAVNYKLQFIEVNNPVMVWSGVHASSRSLDCKAWVLIWIIFQWNNCTFSQPNNLLASHPNYCNAEWKLFRISIKLTITDNYTLDISTLRRFNFLTYQIVAGRH